MVPPRALSYHRMALIHPRKGIFVKTPSTTSTTLSPSIPAMALVLLTLAAGLFLTGERGTAQTFGFPHDSGWTDIGIARDIALKGSLNRLSATASPGYALILSPLSFIARGDHDQIMLMVKLAGMFALSLIAWACLTLVRGLRTLSAQISLTVILALSPTVVWMGASGMSIVWASALIMLGMAEIHGSRSLRGAVMIAASPFISIAALPVAICAPFLSRRDLIPRTTIAILGIGLYILMNLALTDWSSPLPAMVSPDISFARVGAWLIAFLSTIGLWPGMYTPLLVILAVAGTWRLRGDSIPLWIITIAPTIGLAFLLPTPDSARHLTYISVAPLIVLASAGVTESIDRLPKIPPRVVLYVLLGAYVLWAAPAFRLTQQLYGWQVENTVFTGRKAVEWLGDSPASESIATTAPGVTSYWLNRPVIDLTRVTTITDALHTHQPHHLLVNSGAGLPAGLKKDYRAVKSARYRIHAGVYASGPLVLFKRVFRESVAMATETGGQQVR
jgi:hypothetical protein